MTDSTGKPTSWNAICQVSPRRFEGHSRTCCCGRFAVVNRELAFVGTCNANPMHASLPGCYLGSETLQLLDAIKGSPRGESLCGAHGHGRRARRIGQRRGGIGHLGQTEIEHLHLFRGRHDDIGRLQVPVDNARSCAYSSASAIWRA
jgi:hypothetical protein